MKIELVSKQVHKFGGKFRKKGEKFMATEAEARVLRALGRAVKVETAAPIVEKPKRAYKRRDLQAESVTAMVDPVPELKAKPPAPSLSEEVNRVRESFRDQFAGAGALGAVGTLHVTRPKKTSE